jgi:hypothetical protein
VEAQEYKYSQQLFDKISSIYPSIAGRPIAVPLAMRMPIEVIYDSPRIKIGFAIYLLLNHMGVDEGQVSQFLDKNNLESSADKIAGSIYSNFNIKVAGMIPPSQNQDEGITLGLVNSDNNLNFRIFLNELLINNREIFAGTLRHELQHLSAGINGISLIYYRRLKRNNFDLSSIKKLEFNTLSEDEVQYMYRKIVNSKKKIRNKKAREEFKSFLEDPSLPQKRKEFRSYVTDESEYRQHLSDILQSIIRNLSMTNLFSETTTTNFIETLYKTISRGNVRKGTDSILDYIINKYDSGDKKVKEQYAIKLNESFYDYMESPHIRKVFIKDLRRYLPVRIKTVFDNIFGSSYDPLPNSEYDKKQFLNAIKSDIALQISSIIPGTFE